MTGNKTIDTVLVGLMSLITLCTLGVFVYTQIIFEKPLPSESVQKKALLEDSADQAETTPFKVEKMIINLSSQSSRLRFADIEMFLVPFKNSAHDKLEQKLPFIKDGVIDIVSNMDPEELNTVAGKVILEQRIRKRINQIFNKSIVKEIYFSRFVIQ